MGWRFIQIHSNYFTTSLFSWRIQWKIKTSKPFRSLRQSFSPITMVTSFWDSLEKLEQAIRDQTNRRKTPYTPHSNNLKIHCQAQISAANFNETRKGPKKIFKNRWNKRVRQYFKKKKDKCRYCERLGIGKRIVVSGLQTKKETKESEWKVILWEVKTRIETNPGE